jgi:hypothetical protein
MFMSDTNAPKAVQLEMDERSASIIDNLLNEMEVRFTRFKSSARNEGIVWDIPSHRARISQTPYDTYTLRFCDEASIVGTALKAAQVFARWDKELRDAGKLQAGTPGAKTSTLGAETAPMSSELSAKLISSSKSSDFDCGTF